VSRTPTALPLNCLKLIAPGTLIAWQAMTLTATHPSGKQKTKLARRHYLPLMSAMHGFLQRLRRLWNALPLRLAIVLIALSWFAKEFYPLSHYPMYSDFTSYDYVVFIADENGNPLPIENISHGIRTARLKKHFNGGLNETREEIRENEGSAPNQRDMTPSQKKPAGRATLEYLRTYLLDLESHARFEAYSELQLYQIGIYFEDGEIVRTEPEFIAAIDLKTP